MSLGAETLLGNVGMAALGMPCNDIRTAQGFFARGMSAELAETVYSRMKQFDIKIDTPIQHCPECPHCKKIAREEALKAMEIVQQLLDKKAKYEKRCKDWVKKIRTLSKKYVEEVI